MVAIQEIINHQYPHFLYVRQSDAEATQDANGSWQTTGAAWKLWASCREETNGKGTQIQAANGRFITFASLIQLPAGTNRIAEGVEVAAAGRELTTDELTDDKLRTAQTEGIVRIIGECLKFDNGRLHCRLWV